MSLGGVGVYKLSISHCEGFIIFIFIFFNYNVVVFVVVATPLLSIITRNMKYIEKLSIGVLNIEIAFGI